MFGYYVFGFIYMVEFDENDEFCVGIFVKYGCDIFGLGLFLVEIGGDLFLGVFMWVNFVV